MEAGTLRQVALGDLDHELASTRRVLERVPEAQLAWKPHAKSWSLGALAAHVSNIPHWQVIILRTQQFDLAAPMPRIPEPRSLAELLERFDANVAELREVLAAATDEALGERWVLRREERVLTQLPRAGALRTFGISHMIHHRAQLGVYLRLLDVPVPGVYGGSADEA